MNFLDPNKCIDEIFTGTRKVALCFLLAFLVSCASNLGMKGFPNVKDLSPLDLSRVPQDLTPYQDSRKNMDFMLPRGWNPTTPDSKVTSYLSSTSGVLAFKKGERGVFYVWCDQPNLYVYPMKALQYAVWDVSPIFEPVRVASVKATRGGEDPYYMRYKGSRVKKGELENYSILTGYKSSGVVSSGCDYMLLGMALNESVAEEMFYDLYAVMQSMK